MATDEGSQGHLLGTLYLVPSLIAPAAVDAVLPNGTLEVARRLRRFIVETPKQARSFLKFIAHPGPIAALELTAIDPLALALADLEAWLEAGQGVGLLSDAGMPSVADPGASVVARAHQLGARVIPLVGPCSVLLALAASGLNGQRFDFLGYLPIKASERERAIDEALRRLRTTGATQIFIETPYRNAALLASLCERLPGDVWLVVAQDLTGATERILAKPAAAWTTDDRGRFEDKRPAIFMLGESPKLPATPRR
ncbi:MAG: SAM-dependent methyltransferase [Casimicrobiaceae bacterium]|nr:SAM-dependent methyltransferase [Casimicrobiaceae bacterium]